MTLLAGGCGAAVTVTLLVTLSLSPPSSVTVSFTL